jgi:hypothetical protein
MKYINGEYCKAHYKLIDEKTNWILGSELTSYLDVICVKQDYVWWENNTGDRIRQTQTVVLAQLLTKSVPWKGIYIFWIPVSSSVK